MWFADHDVVDKIQILGVFFHFFTSRLTTSKVEKIMLILLLFAYTYIAVACFIAEYQVFRMC